MSLSLDVRRHGGVPTLFINGRPHCGMMYYGRPNTVSDFAAAGVHLCTAALSATEPWWIGPNRYDFQAIDRLFDDYVAADSKILLMPRVHFGYGDMAWWAQQNPGELAVGLDDRGRPVDYFARAADNGVGCPFSFASRKFVRDASRALTALVKHLERRDDGERVFGYHVAGGISAEWFAWWTYIDGCAEDYGAPCRAAFRQWLKRRYRGSVVELRRAWRDRRVTFENTDVPAPHRFDDPRSGVLRDPARAQPVIDFCLFFSEQTTAAIDALCGAVKRACRGRKLVGVFYGYMWPHWNNLSPARQGHVALARLLKSRHVDFIVAPYHYDHRGLHGVHYSQTLPAAIHAAGKLHLDEIDTFTHLTRWPYESLTTVRHARTPDESRRVLRRDAAALIARGGAAWWMDLLHQHWHGHPAIVDTIRAARRTAERLIDRDRRSAGQIAVFVDDRASAFMRPGSDLPYHLLTAMRQFDLSRIGAPFDERLLSDLLRDDLPDYRLCIFPNAWRLTPALRAALRRYVMRDGRWSLWLYAADVYEDSSEERSAAPPVRLSAAPARELLGIRLRMNRRWAAARIELTARRHPLLAGLRRGAAYGAPIGVARQRETIVYPNPRGWTGSIAPWFAVEDAAAEPLGRAAGTTAVGLALRRFATHTVVFSAMPCPPARLLRNLAAAAGVHLWTNEGCVVAANRSFVGVKSEAGGWVRVRPPGGRLRSLDGHPVRRRDGAFEVRLAEHDTAWLEWIGRDKCTAR